MHFDVVLSEFIHPCSKKRRRAQYSCRVDAAVCVRALQMCVRVRASEVCAENFTQHATVPLFCRFVLPCQILLPPIKTVGSTIRQRKCYLLNCVLLMYTPTTTLKLALQ